MAARLPVRPGGLGAHVAHALGAMCADGDRAADAPAAARSEFSSTAGKPHHSTRAHDGIGNRDAPSVAAWLPVRPGGLGAHVAHALGAVRADADRAADAPAAARSEFSFTSGKPHRTTRATR